MGVALSTIRSRIATALNAVDSLAFKQSRNPFQEWGRAPNTVAHLNYAVGITSSIEDTADRQRTTPEGVMVRTTAAVRFAYRIRPKDQVTSYDESFNAAEVIMRTITVRSAPLHTGLQIRFSRIIPDMTDSGEYTTTIVEFEILHYLSLT